MRCATSLDQLTVGQRVDVADLAAGRMRPAVVTVLQPPDHVEVRYEDGSTALHRSSAIVPGPLPPGQLALFGVGA
ncbi:hypothetical protein [Mycolicibacter algericus]|uniref:Uncharacterized protein n=2 Tax=Mycolicibacter algericus TaxID=1288388 RepID=A0A7I9YGU0_MYCAL|nr:hypothetical protein [Mycolicibacter algericus]GFG83367.1 hypothetical protein MALGJ_00430 [Mycolicibacter algericus]GFG87901.1 hypothetical protein MALGJ_45770 [Mycolicibacter algericus]